jgi:EAL domain-containing protein (putative c-di-GMP-specific phosphodiesterase class I)/CheY-like chemotaxis protein
MSEALARPTSAAPGSPACAAEERADNARTPLCFVVDGDASIRQFLSLLLHGAGLDTEEFADGAAFRAALTRRSPDLVFLNIPLESTDAIECVVALGTHGYGGYVQLMSNRGAAVLEHVKSIGQQRRLHMLTILKKPFETGAVLQILRELKLGYPPTLAARIDLDEALRSGWIEFWYQPKIDLRKKQLVGVEALARARHPQSGLLTPETFMPGADESSVVTLCERAIEDTLRAALNFAKLGVNLRPTVNFSISALAKVAIADIVQTYRPRFENWPGLIIDVPEVQIVPELALAHDVAKKLRPFDVHLAIDNFGRRHAALANVKELPFAELKLDRTFVTDCSTDKINAPLCKTVIVLAHSFGAVAAANGIEKASDAVALVSMGCDYGQGFLLGQPMPEERFIALLRQRTAPPSRQPAA